MRNAVAAILWAMAGWAGAAPSLRCAVEVPSPVVAGEPVLIRFTLTNTGTAALQLLRWNTPFEGAWLGPFVSLSQAGRSIAYQGPQVKRGEPLAEHYLLLAAGASASADIDLGQVFDLTRPGPYTVRPQLRFADHFPANLQPPPRMRREHDTLALPCPSVSFRIPAASAAPHP
jgi:hypothetical protein